MIKKFTIISFVIYWILMGIPTGDCQQQASSKPSWYPMWEKAKNLEKAGSYLDAKKIYESLIKDRTSDKQKHRIRREYENLNIKIILSPTPTPDSIFHEVIKGDTLSELAKKYGTTIDLIRKSNNLSEDKIYAGSKLKIYQAKFSIVVRNQKNLLILLANGRPVKRYKVATGEKNLTPVGTFKVVNKLKDPTWYHAGRVLPPGSSKNILGTRWLGFDKSGYGIHGTTLPQTIGTHASKGCIRMLNQDVEEIYSLIPVGTAVKVLE